MTKLLWENLLGIEPATWTQGGRWELDWIAAPSGDVALGLSAAFVTAAALLWRLYRWEASHLAGAVRLVLLGLRLTVLVLVAVMLLEPVVVLSKEEWIPSHLLVLVDSSESMGLRDAWHDESAALRIAKNLRVAGGAEALRKFDRLELVKRHLTDEFLKSLAADGDRVVHMHTFAEGLDEAVLDTERLAELKPAGDSTGIGNAVQQSLLAYAGMPLAGILLISDGQSTGGTPPSAAAKLAADDGTRIVGVAVGTKDGPRNATVASVEASPVVFVRDTNQLTIHVRSRGMRDVSSTLVVEQRRDGGEWQELGRETLVLNLDGAMQSATFDFSETRPGKIEFRAKLEDAGAELSTDDNVAFAETRVIRQRLRVLLIAGSTFPEVQFLCNAFLRDRGIDLSSWLMAADKTYEHPGDSPIRRLPATHEELSEYDCVILYDPDPDGWDPSFSELLANFVSKAGGGLVYVAGEMQTASAFDRQPEADAGWLNLLPVIREPGLFRSEVQLRLSARQPWSLQITDEGSRDPIFAFAEDTDANQRILDSLPGMFWHFPVTRAKPGATVLAVHGDPRMRNEFGPDVLLATQLVGPGRTVFVGFDSTYRWRYLDEQFFDGFWARVVDKAGRNKQLGGVYPFRLSTPQSTFKPGSQVKLIARFHDPSDVDPGLQVLHGEMEHGDDDPMPLTLNPTGEPGEFAASLTVNRPGTHFIRVWIGDEAGGASVKAATLPLDVQLPNLEFENPTLDRAQLETIAATTGGRIFDLSDTAAIADTFTIKRVSRLLEDRQEIWDAPLLIGLVFLLLVVEWVLRKRCRLI